MCLLVCDQVDDNIGLLMSELNRTGLWGRINVVITSDHGMAQCSPERLIQLDECLPEDNYTLVDLTPVAALFPNQSNHAELISYYIMKLVSLLFCALSSQLQFSCVCCPGDQADAVFKALSKCHPHMTAYLKKSIPDRLHYQNNVRIQPIILIADEGWTIVKKGKKLPRRTCFFFFRMYFF